MSEELLSVWMHSGPRLVHKKTGKPIHHTRRRVGSHQEFCEKCGKSTTVADYEYALDKRYASRNIKTEAATKREYFIPLCEGV